MLASSPALSLAFIACSMKSGELKKSWGRPGNEAIEMSCSPWLKGDTHACMHMADDGFSPVRLLR